MFQTRPFYLVSIIILIYTLIHYKLPLVSVPAQCSHSLPRNYPSSERIINPRFKYSPKHAISFNSTVWIQNATLLNGDGLITPNTDIVFSNGIIIHVFSTLFKNQIPAILTNKIENITIINANSRYVTPGLIDVHSHMGTDAWPELKASSDTNEMSISATVPQLKSIDGFNPDDRAIPIINQGGVTTSLVLPGSGNLMGGEAFAFKTRVPFSKRSQHMLLNVDIPDTNKWRWMKMACGENPKNEYGPRGMMPNSRLGSGWLFRQKFEAALKLKQDQDNWCSSRHSRQRYPTNEELESMVALLRGNVKLHVHCYETHDIEMMIRLSNEYSFNISAFHHASEAWQVPDLLAKNNIGAAIFADHWGFKKEAYDSNVRAAEILTAHGVNVVFKSDHPVLNSQHLIFEAAKAHAYGLDQSIAIKAVTSVPAKLMGQDWRIGMIRPGYDADLVIWDRKPLEIGAKPVKVFTDGYETYSSPSIDINSKVQLESTPIESLMDGCIPGETTFKVINVKKIYADQDTTYTDASIVVKNGIITCIGVSGTCHTDDIKVIDANNGSVIPGIIAGHSRVGLEEIPSEDITSNGETATKDSLKITRAVDGLRLGISGSRLLKSMHSAGVLSAISIERSSQMIIGMSTAVRTGAINNNDGILKEISGIHVKLGSSVKTSYTPTLSAQIAKLREILKESINSTVPNDFSKVVSNEIPLFIHVNEANDILKVISLKKEIELKTKRNLDFNIIGGSEAWTVAKELSKASISVILTPARCTPGGWESQKCLIPGTLPSAAGILVKEQVKLGLSVSEDNFQRGLIWEAGWIRADDESLTVEDVIGMLTWNLSDMYKLGNGLGRIQVGERSNFVMYSGEPGQLSSRVMMVSDNGKNFCNPQQQ